MSAIPFRIVSSRAVTCEAVPSAGVVVGVPPTLVGLGLGVFVFVGVFEGVFVFVEVLTGVLVLVGVGTVGVTVGIIAAHASPEQTSPAINPPNEHEKIPQNVMHSASSVAPSIQR